MKTLTTVLGSTLLLVLLLVLVPLGGCATEEADRAAARDEHAGHGHAAAAERCAAHDAPLSDCFICDASLRDADRLWCGGHGRYEDRCWTCQPDLRDPDRAYCERHGLYEDECHLCDPALAPAAASASASASTAGPAGGLYCTEHDVSESDCGICHPEFAADLAPGREVLVRLPSARSADLAGVTHGTARVTDAGAVHEGYAEIDYDRNRFARITPRVGGVVDRVFVDVGETVAAGAPLVRIASARLAEAKRGHLDAALELELRSQEMARARNLRDQEIGSERAFQEAVAAEERARARVAATGQQLLNLGLSEADVAAVLDARDTSAELVIRAPFAGEVIDRAAVLGESVAPDTRLLSVADLSRMRLDLSLPQSALPHLRTGLTVTARFDALPGRDVTGTVVWVATALDERTRLVRARAEVANPDRRLKAGLYGRAEVGSGPSGPTLTLPRDAVCDLDRRSFVLVRREADLYALRRVELGGRRGDAVAVLAGLGPDETVVTGRGFAVFSELLKSRFGAGCAEE